MSSSACCIFAHLFSLCLHFPVDLCLLKDEAVMLYCMYVLYKLMEKLNKTTGAEAIKL